MGIVRDNPILWREGMPRVFRHACVELRVGLILLVAAVSFGSACAPLLIFGNSLASSADILAMMLAAGWMAAAILMAPNSASRSIAAERKSGNWDMLIITRLRGREILFGKLLANLLPLWAIGLFILPVCIFLSVMAGGYYQSSEYASLGGVALIYGIGFAGSLGAAALGVFFSLVTTSDIESSVKTYLCLVMLGPLAILGGYVVLLIMNKDFGKLDHWKREQTIK